MRASDALGSNRAARERDRQARENMSGLPRAWAATKAWFKRVRERFKRVENPVWRGRLRDLEAQFGGAYASYFIFMRWLFQLNCLLAVVCTYLILGIGIAVSDWNNYQIDMIPYLPSWVRPPALPCVVSRRRRRSPAQGARTREERPRVWRPAWQHDLVLLHGRVCACDVGWLPHGLRVLLRHIGRVFPVVRGRH